MHNTKGFVLKDMLIILVVAGALIAVIFPVVKNQMDRTRETTAISNAISTVNAANLLYMSGSGDCPTPEKISQTVGTGVGIADGLSFDEQSNVSFLKYHDFRTDLYVKYENGTYNIVSKDEVAAQISNADENKLRQYFTTAIANDQDPQATDASDHSAMFKAADIVPGTYFTVKESGIEKKYYVNIYVQSKNNLVYYPVIYGTKKEVTYANGVTPGIADESDTRASYIYYNGTWYKGDTITNVWEIGSDGITKINKTLEDASENPNGHATEHELFKTTYKKVDSITLVKPEPTS